MWNSLCIRNHISNDFRSKTFSKKPNYMHSSLQHIKWACGVSHSICLNPKVAKGLGIWQDACETGHGAC